LKNAEFLSYTIAKHEDKIAKLKQEVRDEKDEYKRNRLKSVLQLATVANLLSMSGDYYAKGIPFFAVSMIYVSHAIP